MTADIPRARFDTGMLPYVIVSGLGCREDIPRELDRFGFTRILVLCGPRLRRHTTFIDEIAGNLAPRSTTVFDQVEPHNPDTVLDRIAALASEHEIEAVIAIGGGAVLDAAKAVALMVPSGMGILNFALRFEPPATFRPPTVNVEPLPIFTIPSTFSAAEVLCGGGVTDTAANEKRLFLHPGLAPKRVFLDGGVVASTPLRILRASGLNAVHHCIEALCSTQRQPLSDAFALAALMELMRVLPALAPSSEAPKLSIFQDAVNASAMSGMSYANSGLGVGHAICHSLGGRYGLSHGDANAVMVRHSLRFNADWSEEPLARMAAALNLGRNGSSPAQQVIDAVEDLADRLQTPRTLRDIGLPPGQFEQIARDALGDPLTYVNPRPVTGGDIIALLQQAW